MLVFVESKYQSLEDEAEVGHQLSAGLLLTFVIVNLANIINVRLREYTL